MRDHITQSLRSKARTTSRQVHTMNIRHVRRRAPHPTTTRQFRRRNERAFRRLHIRPYYQSSRTSTISRRVRHSQDPRGNGNGRCNSRMKSSHRNDLRALFYTFSGNIMCISFFTSATSGRSTCGERGRGINGRNKMRKSQLLTRRPRGRNRAASRHSRPTRRGRRIPLRSISPLLRTSHRCNSRNEERNHRRRKRRSVDQIYHSRLYPMNRSKSQGRYRS